MRPKLVLFDIDGTLIKDAGAAREAFAAALDHTYSFRDSLARYDFSGQTDPQIAHQVLGDAGLSRDEIDAALPSLWSNYLRGLSERATADRIEALPGSVELLEQLHGIPHVTLALLTGNIERGARIKLGPPDLNRFFEVGAFGSDSPRREELPPIAAGRVLEAYGRHFQGSDVVIVGDSVFDVRCGIPHGATTIAVSSGRTAASFLAAENPSFLFPSLRETEQLVAAISAE